MRFLLDTHIWLWAISEPERLGPETMRWLDSSRTEVYLSSVSSWEITIKTALGKLTLPTSPEALVTDSLETNGFLKLDIAHAHSCAVGLLPDHHRDPFDRLLVAQALVEGLTLLTADQMVLAYPCATYWALN